MRTGPLEIPTRTRDLVRDKYLAHIRKFGVFELWDAPSRLLGDEDLVLAAVAQDASVLQYAPDELRNDRDFVLVALAQNVSALQYAPDELRNEKGFVLQAVEQNDFAFLYASDELRSDRREFVSEVVALVGDHALNYASKKLRFDKATKPLPLKKWIEQNVPEVRVADDGKIVRRDPSLLSGDPSLLSGLSSGDPSLEVVSRTNNLPLPGGC